ncbi:transmembrane amino acid transporter protein [Ostertagia ostertagi]
MMGPGCFSVALSFKEAGLWLHSERMMYFQELIFHGKYSHLSLPAVTDFSGVTIAAGGLMYAFEGQAMVLALENRLKTPSDMVGLAGVLSTSMNVVMLIYAFLGFFGYLTFGPSVAGSLTNSITIAGPFCESITIKLPCGRPQAEVTVKLLLVAKIFLGSALQLYVIISILSPSLSARFFKAAPRRAIISEYILRVVLTISRQWRCRLCPEGLYDIIPLVGITAGMLLSLILLPFFHTLHVCANSFLEGKTHSQSDVLWSSKTRRCSDWDGRSLQLDYIRV